MRKQTRKRIIVVKAYLYENNGMIHSHTDVFDFKNKLYKSLHVVNPSVCRPIQLWWLPLQRPFSASDWGGSFFLLAASLAADFYKRLPFCATILSACSLFGSRAIQKAVDNNARKEKQPSKKTKQ